MRCIQAVASDWPLPDRYLSAMNQCRKVFGSDYERTWFIGGPDPATESDLLRLNLACEIPDLIWIDWDYWIESVPVIRPGLPYAVHFGRVPHESLFAVNGNCRMFREMRRKFRRWIPGTLNRLFRSLHAQEFGDDFKPMDAG